jgi:hypothetical protein
MIRFLQEKGGESKLWVRLESSVPMGYCPGHVSTPWVQVSREFLGVMGWENV